MIRLMQFLIHGCFHKYSVLREIECTNEYGGRWIKYILRCEKCGKMSKFESA
jgi:hypothetical protein